MKDFKSLIHAAQLRVEHCQQLLDTATEKNAKLVARQEQDLASQLAHMNCDMNCFNVTKKGNAYVVKLNHPEAHVNARVQIIVNSKVLESVGPIYDGWTLQTFQLFFDSNSADVYAPYSQLIIALNEAIFTDQLRKTLALGYIRELAQEYVYDKYLTDLRRATLELKSLQEAQACEEREAAEDALIETAVEYFGHPLEVGSEWHIRKCPLTYHAYEATYRITKVEDRNVYLQMLITAGYERYSIKVPIDDWQTTLVRYGSPCCAIVTKPKK